MESTADTHKKRAQRSSRRRSHGRPPWTRARPPCSPQPPSGWLTLPPSCARPLPLPHSSMPSSVPTPMMRTCPSSRYKWSCGDMWFRQLGCLLGHRYDDRVGLLGPAHKKIRPKSVPGRVSTPIWHVGHYDIALAAHARSRFSSMMRRFWTVIRTRLKSRQISHLFEGWGCCGSLREAYS